MHIRRSHLLLVGLVAAVVIGSVSVGWAMHLPPFFAAAPPASGRVSPPVVSQTDVQMEQLQRRLRTTPDDWKAANELGDVYLQKVRETGDPGYYPKAAALLRQSLDKKPDNFNAMVSLGTLALAQHQFSDALTWGKKARPLNPSLARTYGVIGDAQIELGQYPEAILTFQQMINLRPDLSSYARVSYARELFGDLEGAVEMMQKAIVAGGGYPENTAYLRVQLAGLYFTRGDLAAAAQENTEALRVVPEYAPALAGLGRVDAARGNYRTAIGRYQQAVNRMPLPEYVIALGDIQEAAGFPADAARSFDLARVQNRLYTANGVDIDVELALFEADHGGDLTRTLALARSAMDRRPSIRAADTLAWTLSQSGEHRAAQPLMQQALRLGTQDPLLFFHAGMIAHRLGDTDAARNYLAQAIALNPRFSVRYAALAQQTLDQNRAGGRTG